ncbi:MAG TPA: hypothetical protein VGM23_09450 [Armatimonadota bacterium]|jgi:hypothetical protein
MQPFLNHFDAIQQQFRAWWRRENDRPLLYVPAHWPKAAELPPPPTDPRDNYLDADTIVVRETARAAQIQYAGACFPFYSPFPATASFYGAHPTFTQQTIWHQPVLEGDHPYDELTFDEESPAWRDTVAMYTRLVELADGHFYVSLPNCYSPLDLLEALRGGTNLALDLVECPDEVMEAQGVILEAWSRMYDTFYAIHQQRFAGTGPSFLPAWAPGRSYAIQCDFCCMISAEMFEEFVVPEVEAQAQWVDYSLFHLDGPDAARHADQLLAIPELNGIQWQKGVNGGQTLSWLPLLQQIQRAGKLLMVDCLPHEAEELCASLEPEGLFVATAVDTPEEADALLKKITG